MVCALWHTEIIVAIIKRPCSNCPFRRDGAGIALAPGRLEGIVETLLADDRETFVCHKTLDAERMTCAGAVGVMAKMGRLPLIARLGLAVGVITPNDVKACAEAVIDTNDLTLSPDVGAQQGPKALPKSKDGAIG